MRSIKKVGNPILNGLQIYYNYIHEHQCLQEKKTPAEKCRIRIEGENKGITLIQKESKKNVHYIFK